MTNTLFQVRRVEPFFYTKNTNKISTVRTRYSHGIAPHVGCGVRGTRDKEEALERRLSVKKEGATLA